MENALVFAQMEGDQNHEIHENGAPEAQKCCRGSKFMFAAFESACPRLFVQSNILQPEMVPKWYQNLPSKSILQGSNFEANFEANFFNYGFPRPPPEAGVRGRGGPAPGEVNTSISKKREGFA